MATAGGVSGAAAGTTALSIEELRKHLLTWGIPDIRVQQRAERLAVLGVTLQGLAKQSQDVLPALLAEGQQASDADKFDAGVIINGAKAAAGAAYGSGQASAGAGAGAAADASPVPASATAEVRRTVTLRFRDGIALVEQAVPLVDGKLHLPTVESLFNITNVRLDGMPYPSAADGLTLNTFQDGARIVVTGTPRVADPDPPSLPMSLPFADGQAQLSLLTVTGQKLRKRAVQAGDAGVLSFFSA